MLENCLRVQTLQPNVPLLLTDWRRMEDCTCRNHRQWTLPSAHPSGESSGGLSPLKNTHDSVLQWVKSQRENVELSFCIARTFNELCQVVLFNVFLCIIKADVIHFCGQEEPAIHCGSQKGVNTGSSSTCTQTKIHVTSHA